MGLHLAGVIFRDSLTQDLFMNVLWGFFVRYEVQLASGFTAIYICQISVQLSSVIMSFHLNGNMFGFCLTDQVSKFSTFSLWK